MEIDGARLVVLSEGHLCHWSFIVSVFLEFQYKLAHVNKGFLTCFLGVCLGLALTSSISYQRAPSSHLVWTSGELHTLSWRKNTLKETRQQRLFHRYHDPVTQKDNAHTLLCAVSSRSYFFFQLKRRPPSSVDERPAKKAHWARTPWMLTSRASCFFVGVVLLWAPRAEWDPFCLREGRDICGQNILKTLQTHSKNNLDG